MGSRSPTGRGTFEGMTLKFSRTSPSSVPSWTVVRISLHAVDQRFDWSAAEAVECHLKFSQWKIPCDAASLQTFLTTCLSYFLFFTWESANTGPPYKLSFGVAAIVKIVVYMYFTRVILSPFLYCVYVVIGVNWGGWQERVLLRRTPIGNPLNI